MSPMAARRALLLAPLLAAALTSEPPQVNFDLEQLAELLPLPVRDVLDGRAELRKGFPREALIFVQAALRDAVPGLADSPQWATLHGKYGPATRSAVVQFEAEVLGLPRSDGESISADTVRRAATSLCCCERVVDAVPGSAAAGIRASD